jgi:hypothetical protein
MLNKLTEKIFPTNITDDMLDRLWQLSQRRLIEIEQSHLVIYCNNQPIKAVRDNGTFYFLKEQAPAVGSMFRSGEIGGTYCVISHLDQAGRIQAETTRLPNSIDVYRKHIRCHFEGRPLYNITSTNWRNVPAVISPDKISLPVTYKPDTGDLLSFDQKYFEVTGIESDQFFNHCQVNFFLDNN